jgi:hypothetical protein
VGGVFDEVNLLSADGFKEIKHIEISGLQAVVGSTLLISKAGIGATMPPAAAGNVRCQVPFDPL